jgi:hypothetical protein
VVEYILKSESEWERGGDGEYGHVPGLLSGTPAFTAFVFGGSRRVAKLKRMLRFLSSRTVLHISTKGIISDVVALLQNLNILQHFTLIDGLDDSYESKMCYLVGKGFIQNDRTFYGRASNLQGRSNVTHFASKPDFIASLIVRQGTVIYLDDDVEYYSQLTQTFPDTVLCMDIGQKEGIYATGVPNMSGDIMLKLLRVVAPGYNHDNDN